MASSELTWSDAGREVRRTLVTAGGWICFLLASLPLLFAPHLTRWAAPGLFAAAVLGGACIVYGEVTPWLERRGVGIRR